MATTKITTPELFDFSATNTALQLPTGTTAQRPTSPSAGEWRFNTTEKYVEYWDGGAWKQIDTEAPGNPDDFPSQNFNVNTYFGNGATQAIDAKFNEAANFNGSSSGSQIFISDADVFSPANNDLSFSVWVKTSSTSGGYFASKQNDSTITYEWQFYMNTNGTVVIAVYTSAGSTIATATSTAIVNNGNWHNVAFVIDTNSSITVYVDKAGVTNSSWSGTMSNTSTDVLLGAGGGVPSFRLQGMLDQARFFNTAITQSQIDSLYDSETTTTAATLNFPVGAGCIAAYQLDGDASDLSGTYGGVETDIEYTGLRFQPDFVWIKARSGAANSNILQDSVRGANKALISNSSGAELTSTDFFTSFDNNGFTLPANAGTQTNQNGTSYVAWNFKAGGAAVSNGSGSITSQVSANQDAGFSIVEFTTSSNGTIGHGLTEAPELIITKLYTRAGSWSTYSEPTGNTKYFQLDSDIAATTGTNRWNSTTPSASTFVLGSDFGSGYACICYCFHSVAGYQKIGSYTGNGNANGPIVQTGFEPAFLMIKRSDSSANWRILDNKRSTTNPRNKELYPNLSNSEGDFDAIDFFSNGFQNISTDASYNANGGTYIYLAIAADKDTSVPTQANSFSPTIYTGNGGTQNIYTPFAPDFTWTKSRTGATESNVLNDIIRGKSNSIYSNSSGTQYFASGVYTTSFNPNGFTVGDNAAGNYGVNGNGINYVSWNWKAGGLPTINTEGTIDSVVSDNDAAGFSIVKYAGNTSAATVGHGLSSTPEMIIVKKLGASQDWWVYHKDLNGGTNPSHYFIRLNLSNAEALNASSGGSIWNSTAPTSEVFSTGSTLQELSDYIAYCWTSITGYQKVGSYTGNGNNNGTVVDTGFTPRFVMIKATTTDNGGGNWIIYDNARSTSNPRNKRLFADLIIVEATNSNYDLDFLTGATKGFQPKIGANYYGFNTLNVNYIYLAIA